MFVCGYEISLLDEEANIHALATTTHDRIFLISSDQLLLLLELSGRTPGELTNPTAVLTGFHLLGLCMCAANCRCLIHLCLINSVSADHSLNHSY